MRVQWFVGQLANRSSSGAMAEHAMARRGPRNPGRPDRILAEAAAERSASIVAHTPGTAQWPLCLPACLTAGRIHGEFLRPLFVIADKQAGAYFADLSYAPHKEEYWHRRGVYFSQHRTTVGMACAQAVAPCAAMLQCLGTRRMARDEYDRDTSEMSCAYKRRMGKWCICLCMC